MLTANYTIMQCNAVRLGSKKTRHPSANWGSEWYGVNAHARLLMYILRFSRKEQMLKPSAHCKVDYENTSRVLKHVVSTGHL